MLAPRAAVVVPFVCFAIVACRVATQQNELYMTGDGVESVRLSTPSHEEAEPVDASLPPADASIVGDDADARPAVPPPCTPQTMYGSAPTTTCAVDSIVVAGGTLGVGGYTLTRWADGAKWCTSAGTTSQRRGTMSIENVQGTLFMRWTLSIDGKSTWGTYELAPKTSTSFTRTEVCNASAQTPPVVVSYTATANEILFFHDGGQERWTRIPKAGPDTTVPTEPIFTQ